MASKSIGRRGWLRATAAGLLGGGVAARGAQAPQQAEKPVAGPIKIEDLDQAGVEAKLREAGLEPRRLRSNHYLALGDAAESFMRSSLTDCELLYLSYFRHFKDRGFEVREPEKPLIVLAFRDDVSFGRYFHMPSLMRGGAQPVGMYDRATNVLSVFDWRNVPMASRASSKNVQTVSHEGTHQLTFNSGLLERTGDLPIAIVEGLGTYGEPRKVLGESELGRINLSRADDLAKLRRSFPWIPVKDLLSDDSILRSGLFGRVMLGYAEAWALVHYLLHDKKRMAGFRDYLKAEHAPAAEGRRLDVAKAHLGDLDELDRDLREYAIRVVQSL